MEELTETSIYSGFQICNELKANEKCFRLQEYHDGDYVDVFHEHLPKHRISVSNASFFLKTLLYKRSPYGDSEILRTFINNRGKEPSIIQFTHGEIEYPEPGVIRRYACTHGLNGWFDEVISPNEFRVSK